MHELLHGAVTKALESLKHEVKVKGKWKGTYKVTRSDSTPVKLTVKGPGISFTVDLVPAFDLQLKHIGIDEDLKDRVDAVRKISKSERKSFMAIALWKASKDMFEFDFHDVERDLLASRGGCVYDVIKLMKHARNHKGGNLLKLKSHALKVDNKYLLLSNRPLLDCGDA